MLTFIAVIAGASHRVRVGISDFVRFERAYNLPASSAFEPDGRVEWKAFLIYSALLREGKVAGSFDDFLPTLDDFDLVDEDEDADQGEAPAVPAA